MTTLRVHLAELFKPVGPRTDQEIAWDKMNEIQWKFEQDKLERDLQQARDDLRRAMWGELP